MSDLQRKNNPKYQIGDRVRIKDVAKSGVVTDVNWLGMHPIGFDLKEEKGEKSDLYFYKIEIADVVIDYYEDAIVGKVDES